MCENGLHSLFITTFYFSFVFKIKSVTLSRIVTRARKLQMKLLSYSDEVYVSV